MSCPAQSHLVCLFPAWCLGPSLWGNTSSKLDKRSYKVAAINWAIWGCKVPDLMEDETPGLVHLWEMASTPEPCKCIWFAHCRQVTMETAVFIETLLTLCVEVRWSCYNYLLHPGPRSSWKAETDEEYLRCVEQSLFFKDRRLSMILDDGGTSPTHSHQVPTVLVQVISKETTTGSTTCITSSRTESWRCLPSTAMTPSPRTSLTTSLVARSPS